MLKFDFSVKTRDGQKVDSILTQGKDFSDAERKLRQMYHHCEVTQCRTITLDKAVGLSSDIEEMLALIAKQN